jgi:general secretion pathway protein K
MTMSPEIRSDRRRESGIALAIVLVLVVLMVSAVYAFSRRAIINVHVTENRLMAAKADAAARGALRVAEAAVYLIALQEQTQQSGAAGALLGGAGAGGGEIWTRFEDFPIELESGETIRLSIEELSGRLNLNALVPQKSAALEEDDPAQNTNDLEQAAEYLDEVLQHIIEGIDVAPGEKNYETERLAENLIDYMDGDEISLHGGSENEYYGRQDPPYTARNGPFLSFEEIGLVEGVDAQLLEAMRDYVTVHPIGGRTGVDLNRAKPWVLPLVYAGPSGDRELLRDSTLRQILAARKDDKILCTDQATDPTRCISLSDVGLDEGSIYPETILPAPVSVFRVVATAQSGSLTRKIEAIYDTRPLAQPQLLSWRRLRGPN